jgi:C-terminal processing protease CtpA/Prc
VDDAATVSHPITSPHIYTVVTITIGNPGGLLDQAVEISSYLVPPNSNIVSSKSKSGPEIIYRSANNIQPIIPAGMKLVVLVNKGSASAAEIVSGAIQDLDAGVVVGSSRTYGKGNLRGCVYMICQLSSVLSMSCLIYELSHL